MLQRLQQLHASILSGLDELEKLTAQPCVPMDRLPQVRLALTRASRSRTMLLERTYDELIARASEKQQAELRELRAEGSEALVRSAQHIGTWTLREITARWPDYCAASRTMRAEMRARVRKEAALVYPLLAELQVRVSVA